MKTIVLLLLSAVAVLATEEDFQQFVSDSKLFTSAVYNEVLVDNKENILVSPFSVETVLALTQSGAVGTTGKELRASLFLPETKEATETIIKTVLPKLESDKFTLKTANKIYVENNFPIKEDFQKTAKSVYQAAFQNIEFAENVKAAEEINQWVEEETNKKIQNLVDPNDLDEATRVVLINALYFQGNWTNPFWSPPVKTSFYTPEKVVEKELMFSESSELNYYESEDLDAKFVELPLQGGAIFTVVLPNKNEGIAILEKQMTRVLSTPKYAVEYVNVSLPKFKIESTIDFNDILYKLGVHAAFNPEQADFSEIAGVQGEIVISQVNQKTYMEVSEMGIEAAAATEIVGPTSLPPTATKTFKADHPFVFYLKVNDIVLFEGRVLEPTY